VIVKSQVEHRRERTSVCSIFPASQCGCARHIETMALQPITQLADLRSIRRRPILDGLINQAPGRLNIQANDQNPFSRATGLPLMFFWAGRFKDLDLCLSRRDAQRDPRPNHP
jgi:hypothetical protein